MNVILPKPLKLKWMCSVFLLAASTVGLVGMGFAQVAVIEVDPTPRTKPFDVEFGYGYQANTDIKKSGGDFQRNSVRAGLNAEIDFGDGFKLDNILAYEYHNYTFSGSSAFQWEDIHRFVYAPLFKWQASESWTVLAAPIVQWMGEGGADISDAFTGGGLVGFNYQASPDLSLGLLVGVLSQIEDDAILLPIPTANWKFAEKWTLRAGVNRLGPTVGVGGELAWKFAKTVELAGGIQFQKRRFRLDKSNRVAEETLAPAYGKVTWALFPQGNVEFFGSVATNGELRLENKNGNKISDKDYESTTFFGARLHFVF